LALSIKNLVCKIALRYVYIVTMPRNTVEPEGFCNQGAPCHLPTALNTIQTVSCAQYILQKIDTGSII